MIKRYKNTDISTRSKQVAKTSVKNLTEIIYTQDMANVLWFDHIVWKLLYLCKKLFHESFHMVDCLDEQNTIFIDYR